MRCLVICPSDRPAAAFMARARPLALAPVLGRTLLDLWLERLASEGARTALALAADRPDQIRAATGRGEAWGIKIEILPEQREPTLGEARARRISGPEGSWLRPPLDAVVLDRLPSGGCPLWESPASFFSVLRNEIPSAAGDRVGMRELAPGVHVHVRARVSAEAQLQGPCWIGSQAWVAAEARIGPGAILEDGSFVDHAAEVRESFVGPGTYVGAATHLLNSLAWGRGLCQWTTGSFTEVTDAFLLCDLRERAGRRRGSGWMGRLAALAALAVTWPAVAVALWRGRKGPGPAFVPRHAVAAPAPDLAVAGHTVYYELDGFRGLWRRWPELWKIARGEFSWVGNRPVTPSQAGEFTNEFERLWLAAPTGLFSLADAEGCADPFGDEARAHSSFYAASPEARSNWRIFFRTLGRAFKNGSRLAFQQTPNPKHQ